MASHVGEDAAALLPRIPEPGVVRAGMLLGGPSQPERAHGIDDGSEHPVDEMRSAREDKAE